MEDDNILKIGNLYRTIRCLEPILDHAEIDKIRLEFNRNIRQLVNLSNSHLRTAKRVSGNLSWRQRVSRTYYACYCISRAVRLAVKGAYNTDPSDHKNIGDLPDDFPSSDTWSDFLTKLRGDRNIADYDHTDCRKQLEMSDTEYVNQAEKFTLEAKGYLKNRGHL